MSWSQGESDYFVGTSRATYFSLFLQMYNDFATDVTAITNQTTKPVLVSYQLAAHRSYGQELFKSMPMPKQAPIIMAIWKVSFTLSVAKLECAGVKSLNT